jgi:5-formyltetrahydrofolate cyclo-ligase
MNKDQLRVQMKQKIAAQASEHEDSIVIEKIITFILSNFNTSLLHAFTNNATIPSIVKHIGIYYPITGEINLLSLVRQFLQYTFVIPRVSSKTMDFCAIDDHLDIKSYKIPQPKKDAIAITPDIIFAPALAFDKRGYRLGYGKGYYDKFLLEHSIIPTIAVCRKWQLIDYIPTMPHDIPMHFAIF